MPEEDRASEAAAAVAMMERLARLMRSEEHGEGLNPAQWEALRYLARANRFSNSPGALTQYLGATKGTISQTVIALERKGLLFRTSRAGEKRSIALVLTEKGKAALARDPWTRLAAAAAKLGPKTRRRLAKGLAELLADELARGKHTNFGLCRSCRYFREGGRRSDPLGPHLCMLLDEPLSPSDTTLICREQVPA